MRSFGVANRKGGSGKTTTAVCLAAGIAARGRRVLLVDADPQGNASMTMLDGEPGEGPTLGHVLLDQATARDAIRTSRLGGLDVLPSDAGLADAALLLADGLGRERRLRCALRDVAGDYDYAVVDAAPQLDLIAVNVLNAVDALVVPVDAGLYSLAGLAKLQDVVDQVRKYLDNPGLAIAGLVLTRTHNNRATKDIEAQLRAAYGPMVYRATIPHSVRVEEAHARHRTVLEFAPKSSPAAAYDALITEILDDGQQRQPRRPDSALGADPSADAA